jgi:hypothetical protein
MLHDILASCVVIFCLWIIMSPKVPTGFWCTLGAGIVALAALWSIDDYANPYATTTMLLVGIALVAGKMTWRVLRTKQCAMRRRTDWVPEELEAELHKFVAGGKKD